MNEFEFTFIIGDLMHITKGEDGYTVCLLAAEPSMGTFTSFENLLYGIAPYIQNNVASEAEFKKFISSLSSHFAEDEEVQRLKDEIGEILLK